MCLDCVTDYYGIAHALADGIEYGNLFISVLSKVLLEWETGYAEAGGAIEFFSSFTPDVTFPADGPYVPAVMSLDQGLAIQGVLAQEIYLKLMNSTNNQQGPLTANQELYAASKFPSM